MKKVTNKVLWLFAIGQLGWSLLSGIINNWMLFFYLPEKEQLASNSEHALFIPQGAIIFGLTIIGLITFGGRIFDAITDPLIASASDRSKNKNGRRIPFMRRAAIPFAIITTLLFVSPTNRISGVNVAFLSVMSVLFYLFLTLYCTPFNALIPVLGKTQKDRINVSTFIAITFFVGTSVSYLIPNIAGIFQSNLGYINSFRLAVGILSVFAAVCMLIPTIFIKEKDYDDAQPSETPAFKSLAKSFRNKEFRIFVGSDILYWIALTFFQTGLPFYITSLMGLGADKTFILMAIMSVISFILYAPVNILAKKLGKKKLVLFAFIFFSAVFLLTSFSGQLGLSGMANGILISALAAVPMAILGILPQAMVADISEYDAIKTKENREGMFFAARTFAFKMGAAIAMLIFPSIKLIGENGFGLRLTARVAAVFCIFGAIVLFTYNEKQIMKEIKKD